MREVLRRASRLGVVASAIRGARRGSVGLAAGVSQGHPKSYAVALDGKQRSGACTEEQGDGVGMGKATRGKRRSQLQFLLADDTWDPRGDVPEHAGVASSGWLAIGRWRRPGSCPRLGLARGAWGARLGRAAGELAGSRCCTRWALRLGTSSYIRLHTRIECLHGRVYRGSKELT